MPLIFITGASTAGKSTVARELTRRDYLAYDAEQYGAIMVDVRQPTEQVISDILRAIE